MAKHSLLCEIPHDGLLVVSFALFFERSFNSFVSLSMGGLYISLVGVSSFWVTVWFGRLVIRSFVRLVGSSFARTVILSLARSSIGN